MTFPLLLQVIPPILLFVGVCAALSLMTLAVVRLRAAARSAAARRWGYAFVLSLLLLGGSVGGLSAIGFGAGFSKGRVPAWSSTDSSATLEPLIRKHCEKFIADGRSVGLVAAIISDDETCLMGFGHPSLTSSETVNGATLFEIGSITKTFTGLLLASEIQRGGLRLDQPIKDLLPPEVLLPTNVEAVTLQHLTTHSSGFPRLPGEKSAMLPGIVGMLLFGADPYAGFSEDNYLRALQNVKLDFKPGERSSYSNFGVTILGYLLARHAGGDFENLVKTRVCLPLGMSDTTVGLSATQQASFATGYRALLKWGPLRIGLRSKPWDDTRNMEGAGGLRSTGRDMLKYLQANMRPGRQALSPALRETQRERFRKDQRNGVAMGWMLKQTKRLNSLLVWHNGGTGGFRSFIGFDKSGRCGVLIMSNSSESVDDLALGLLAEVTERPTGRAQTSRRSSAKTPRSKNSRTARNSRRMPLLVSAPAAATSCARSSFAR